MSETIENLNQTIIQQNEKIKELENSIIISKDEYQATEQVIGKWTNGKNIYRKVLNVPSVSKSGTVYVSVGAEVENFISVSGKMNSAETPSAWTNLPHVQAKAENINGRQWGIVMYDSRHSTYANTIRIQSGSSESASGGYLIVEYTKKG